MSFSNYYFFFFFFFIVLAIPTHQISYLVTNTCEKTSFLDLCISVLGSAPETDVKDVQDLAKFALKMASLNGTAMHMQISSLLNTSSDEFIKQCLSDCSEIYIDATDQLEDSMVALDFKAFKDINTWVNAAITGSETCENGFKEEKGIVSPLSDLNLKFSQLCEISLAIVKILATS
ncbi:putative invertase inhibitor [Manihot esculenta]|uniref:Pectinesterase inhibitor domain-containing protein n=1 Tax=Manihot esculenta TaxID=3983 RepID=A0A2C9VBP0_MANES|nr:putative invertase inhibitor [Manihot esculenta]OAY42356.1 hypothetical protein MANES_09G173500v8 [Manihot esculenta]